MLTDKELKALFKLFHIKCKGIHLKDEVKDKELKPGFYIYNLDSRKNPVQFESLGTHWTCSVGNDADVFYFDSYGAVPPTEIHMFMKKTYDRYGYNNYIIQDLKSEMCGWYCLGLALFIKENQKKYPNLLQCCNEYIDKFGDDAKNNDIILKKYINDIARNKKILGKNKLLDKLNK